MPSSIGLHPVTYSSAQAVELVVNEQSVLKEVDPECSLEGLLLKLKLQYFGHLM